jgi:predicted GIY-YIG superfamily endonuclease
MYKIVCKDLSITDVYVGSTTNFTNRKRDHKKAAITQTIKILKKINMKS